MLVVKNRSAYVEVRDDLETLFRKNKSHNNKGLAYSVLDVLKVPREQLGSYFVSGSSPRGNYLIEQLSKRDARKAEDKWEIDVIMRELREVEREIHYIGR